METLRGGIRRSDIFMGIGLNTSEHNPPISHFLGPDDHFQIQLVKKELNDEEKKHVAEEFAKWIRAGGIRELLETFSIFMHQLYTAIFLIKEHQKQLDREFNKCRPQRFEFLGIGVQIERMAEIIKVEDRFLKIVRSLNRVRNCYAHRRGLVSAADFNEGENKLTVTWNAFEIQVRENDGNVVLGKDIFGRTFEKGGEIGLKVVERSKDFPAGTELILEQGELKEICLCLLSIGQRLFSGTVDVAKSAGILREK